LPVKLFGAVFTYTTGVGSVIPIQERLFDRLELLTINEVCTILRCHEKTLF
jgi:hypothetical protein